MIGQVIDHYKILEKIGQGGMGTVYKAVDINLDRIVAIKVLSKELSQEASLIQRFLAEAKTQAQLNHPNVCTLYNFFRHQDQLFMVMEYVEGMNLEQMIRQRGAVPFHEAVPLFQQALFGLSQAHRMGILHRDIKPSNMIVNRQGIVKVMDFGIARVMGQSRLTQTGLQVGTLYYMSPEQIQGKETDFRCDIYALGITLFELLTGTVPFRGSTDFEIMQAHVRTPPPSPSKVLPQLPKMFDRAVLHALEKDPRARYQTVEEFSQALGAALQEALRTAPPPRATTAYAATGAAPARPAGTPPPPPGTQAYASGTQAYPPGTQAYPVGTQAYPSGTQAYPPGTQGVQIPGATVFDSRPGTGFPAARPDTSKKKVLIIGGVAAAGLIIVTLAVVVLAVLLKPSPKTPTASTTVAGGSSGGTQTPPVTTPASLPAASPSSNQPTGTLSLPVLPGGAAQPDKGQKNAKPQPTPAPPPPPAEEPPDSGKWATKGDQPGSGGGTPVEDPLQALSTQAYQAYSAGRFIEPPGNNVLQLTGEILRRDPGHAYALQLQQDAVSMVHSQMQSQINSGDLASAKRTCRLLIQFFPANGEYRQLMSNLENAEQQTAAMSQAQTFLVGHDHSGDFTLFCIGQLSIFPDRVVYRTVRSIDGRTDDFEVPRSAIKEFKTNRLPIGMYRAFHIKLTNGNNYNFAHIDQNGNDIGPEAVVAAYGF